MFVNNLVKFLSTFWWNVMLMTLNIIHFPTKLLLHPTEHWTNYFIFSVIEYSERSYLIVIHI